MAQAGIADFQSRFSHVKSAALQQFGRLLHPQLAHVLGNSLARHLREGPAQMEGAASHLAAEFLEAGRRRKTFLQDGDQPVRTVASETFLPVTEQLVIATPLEEEIHHQLQHFAVVPEPACGLENRRTQQMGSQLFLLGSKPMNFAQAVKTRAIAHYPFD